MLKIHKLKNDFFEFVESPLGSQIIIYSLFYAFLWAFHLILISMTSYFHLLLNHNIRVIGDWITDRGWTLIIITKVVVFYLLSLFYKLKTQKIFLLQSYLRNSIQTPRLEFIAFLTFILLGTIAVGKIQVNKTMIIEVPRFFLSTIGTVVFYGVDFFVLITLNAFYPIYDSSVKLLRVLIFSSLFYFYTSATFVYEQTITINLFLLFFIMLYLCEWRRTNWTLPFLFLILYIFPLYTLMGADPVWGEIYSPFFFSKKITPATYVLITIISLAYLHYKEKKYPEYIYRD